MISIGSDPDPERIGEWDWIKLPAWVVYGLLAILFLAVFALAIAAGDQSTGDLASNWHTLEDGFVRLVREIADKPWF